MSVLGAAGWLRLAADVVASYPLAGTDWAQHSDAVDSGFYSVRAEFLTDDSSPSDTLGGAAVLSGSGRLF